MKNTVKYNKIMKELNKTQPFRLEDMLYGFYFTKEFKEKVTKNPQKLQEISIHFQKDVHWIEYELGKKKKKYCEEDLWYNKENAIKALELWHTDEVKWEEIEELRKKDLEENKNKYSKGEK